MVKMTFQTIRVSSCLSIQGEFVEALASGEVLIRDGGSIYRGQPIQVATSAMTGAAARAFEFVAAHQAEPA